MNAFDSTGLSNTFLEMEICKKCVDGNWQNLDPFLSWDRLRNQDTTF